MKINNDFNVGDVIIRCRDFACKVYANFYQVTKVLDDKLIIHPIYSLYTSISGDGEGYDPYDEETENAEVTVVCRDGERLERNFGDILKEYRSYKTR